MQQIGRYQIIGEVGRGAMGIVYRALDPAIGRTIAIKSIRLTDLSDEIERVRLRERLFREASTAGVLSHPNIVTIYDILEEDGLAYIFMEFVNGPGLEKVLSSKHPDKELLLSVLRQTAGALDYAHKRGIVHRDIKPANIMLHEETIAKVTDFGVAKIVSQQMTQSGTMMGTPSFMAPEQVQGGEISGQADQFSLAVIAYEMLTGERPFVADTLPSLLYKICRDEPAPPQRLNTTLAAEVEPVFQRALAKQASARYATCADFIADLERALAQQSDWTPLPRGLSPSLPTISTGRDAVVPGELVAAAAAEPTLVSTAPVIAPVERNEQPLFARARLEQEDSHTARNIFLAISAVIVIGTMALLAQRWMEPAPAPLPPVEPPKVAVTTPPPAEPVKTEPAEVKPPQPETPAPKPQPAPPVRVIPQPEVAREPVMTRFVVSPPGANVLVDGLPELSCSAPCSMPLPPGRHVLSVKAEGFHAVQRAIETPRDEQVSVDLEQAGGTLALSSNVAGCSIIINGKERPEKTPITLRLPAGTYQVKLVKGTFECETDVVNIKDGTLARRRCDMQ